LEIFIKPKLKAFTGSKTTTINTYVTIPDAVTALEYWFCRGFKSKYFTLKATLNNLLYSIDVSADGTVWFNVKTDQAIASGVTKSETHAEIWPYYRVQVKPAVAGVHGKLEVAGEMSTL